MPQNTTCRVPVNTKIRPAGRIECNREKRLDAALVTLNFVKRLLHKSVNKISIQSKALFPIALHYATVPNSATHRQTMPQAYNRMKLIGSLLLNDGRKTGSPCFRNSRQHAFRNVGKPASLIAGMQESKKARLHNCPKA